MRRFSRLLVVLAVALSSLQAQDAASKNTVDYETFQTPPAQYRGRTMMDMNLSSNTAASLRSSVDKMAQQQKYGGVFFVATGASGRNLNPNYVSQGTAHLQFTEKGIEYLSDEFFQLYGAAVAEAKRDGLSFVLYDDYAYPTGTVGGQIYSQYPQYMAKRLDKVEIDGSGPSELTLPVPEGIYVGAVLFNPDSHETRDVSGSRISDGSISAKIPPGRWKLMVFYLNREAVLKIRNPGLVDYLDEDAMKMFLHLTYDKFYSHLKPFFGSTITMSFFDEPTLHWLDGRTWTPTFNRRFEEKYGRSPMAYYPALWYDIGPDTAAARNALYGFRAELFSTNFVGRIAQWCHQHGIQGSGHLDQEEVVNPVPTNGDLMKAFEHQDIPGADDISYLGRANRGYKVVTSAAYNYDKPVVMAETYAAYEHLDDKIVFQTAMDQFAMGISLQMPWEGIDPHVRDVPALNEYVGRLSYLLQHGRHVSDIAVLYPIAALQTAYSFQRQPLPSSAKLGSDLGLSELAKAQGPDWEYAYNGGTPPPEIDYMDIGEILFRGLRTDFTYLHPEVLTSKTTVKNRHLILENTENREEYRILIVPGGDTLSASAATKIAQFYQGGGTVIATSKLPFLSAEFGQNATVRHAFTSMFNISEADLVGGKIPNGAAGYFHGTNSAGGHAYFLPSSRVDLFDTVLREALPARDVSFSEPSWPLTSGHNYKGALTYIHKQKDGRDIYFFANSSEKEIRSDVFLRGKKQLSIWNPHTGDRRDAEVLLSSTKGEPVTRIELRLPPVSSLFYISK